MKNQFLQKKPTLQQWRWQYEFKISNITTSERLFQFYGKFGFVKVSQKGSHAKYRSIYSNRVCIIPIHSEIARGTLKSILEQADISIDDFLNQL